MTAPAPQTRSLLATRAFTSVRKVFLSPVAVFLLAFIARLKLLADFLPHNGWASGFYRYNEPSHIAAALVAGLGFSAPWANAAIAPTAQQPPVYPLLLAGIFKLLGVFTYASLWAAALVNAILASVTAVLILRLGQREFNAVTGALAAWVWACSVYEATMPARLWESSLSALLLVVALLMLSPLSRRRTLGLWIAFGALVGFSALTNMTLTAVLPFFLLWLWITSRRQEQPCGKLVLASVVSCVLLVAPWTIRNYIAFHKLIPVRDNFGLELWVGVELGAAPPPTVITRAFPRDFPLADATEFDRMGEIGYMESRRRLAFAAIRQHPGEYVRALASRCLRYWKEPPNSYWGVISVLAWLGTFFAVKKKKMDGLPYLLVLVNFPVVYYVTHTFATYRHPMEPVMLLLAAYSLVHTALFIERDREKVGRVR